MQKINESQIDQLYSFTKQHFVEHYDLQTELVDHLANDIESIWIKNPGLSFEEARDQSFKKFGIFGFMDVVSERAKTMSKNYYRYFWQELKVWFGIPKIIITTAIFCLCYIGFSSAVAYYFFLITYAAITIWITYRGFKLNRAYKKRKRISGRKWMLEEMIFKQAGGAGILLISQFPSYLNILDGHFESLYVIWGSSIFTTIMLLICYVSFQLLPNKAETLLNETYPEFKTVFS